MIEINKNDLFKYALGIIILLIFILLLGIYLFFLSKFQFGLNSNGAGVLFATQSGDDLDQRLASVQSEIDDTLARVKKLEGGDKPALTPVTPSVTPATVPKYLKISKFSASQTMVQSGSQITFSYAAENTARGVSYRLLIQCPDGVVATYSNGANVCRRSIAEAMPIDNSGSYLATFTNNSAEPRVVIIVLLASDITDNSIFFRDSRVLTVTIMPSGSSPVVSNEDASVVLSSTPAGAPAPATISFTATINDIKICHQSHWEFGDGISSETFAICPNSFSSVKARTIFENHQYNQPGTYTATFIAGNKRASQTIYISAPTALYSAPVQYTPVYTYSIPQPVYNYTYTPQPVYNYNLPSLPDVPTTPTNFRAVASNNNSITLSWSAPVYGNVVNYTIYRIGGASLATPIAGSPSSCGNNNSANICYYTVSGNLTSFVDGNVTAGNTYTYRIVAGNGYGSSNFSDSLTVSLAQSNSPTVPRTFTASVNGGRIILSWSAPASGTVSNYTIYRKGGSSLSIPIITSPTSCNNGGLDLCYYYTGGQTFTLTDSNLTPNTVYTYRIIATNPFGTSEYSDSLTVVSGQVDPPTSTPTLNPANRVDALSTVQLSWNSVGANYYRVFRSTNRNDATPANDDLVSGCTVGTTNVCFLNVSGDSRVYSLQAVDSRYDVTKTYYYRVRAYGQNGASNWSNEVSAVPSAIIPPSVPDPVITSFTIDGQTAPTVASGASVNLSYSGTNVASYKLFIQCPANVSIHDANNGSSLCRINSNDAISVSSSGSYRIGLYNMGSSGQAVNVTLMAYRANGTVGHSITRSVTVNSAVVAPIRASVPRNLRISQTIDNIYLVWDAPVSGVPQSYVVVRKIGSVASTQYTGLQACNGNSVDPCFLSSVSANIMDSNSIVGSSYTYVALASNQAGLSDPSNSIYGTVQTYALHAPRISDYKVEGHVAPTVSSGASLVLTYSGMDVASYRLYVQCPANVAVPDGDNSSNVCRINASDAISVPSNGAPYSSGSYRMSIYNMNSTDQLVYATLMAMRTDGTLSNSITRTITVHPQSGF